MESTHLFPRLVEPRVTEALTDTPVVFIHGPRQCGKTTLARAVGDHTGRHYVTLDDAITHAAAAADPVGFVADLPGPCTIDEVQRVPELFLAIKAAVDRERTPGRFLLTGSASLSLVPALSEALVGRMEVVRLHPLAQVELERRSPWFLPAAFESDFGVSTRARLGADLARRIVRGGYPEPALRPTDRRRAAWYEAYVDTIIQRDIKEFARIRRHRILPKLLSVVASQTARLVNISSLAAPFELSRPAMRDYVTLLAGVFLLEETPPWHSNRLSRVVKTAKLHVVDTGLACALLGVDTEGMRSDRELLGQLLETFVYQELRRQACVGEQRLHFHHFRDRYHDEVDIVVENGKREILGVEVKSAASVRKRDFRGLRKLQAAAGERFRCGIVLHDGETAAPMGNDLYALPISSLWDRPQ